MSVIRVRTSVSVGKRKSVRLGPFARLSIGWRRTFYPFGRPARRRRRG